MKKKIVISLFSVLAVVLILILISPIQNKKNTVNNQSGIPGGGLKEAQHTEEETISENTAELQNDLQPEQTGIEPLDGTPFGTGKDSFDNLESWTDETGSDSQPGSAVDNDADPSENNSNSGMDNETADNNSEQNHDLSFETEEDPLN